MLHFAYENIKLTASNSFFDALRGLPTNKLSVPLSVFLSVRLSVKRVICD